MIDKRLLLIFWITVHLILYIVYYHLYFLEGITSTNYVGWIKAGDFERFHLPVFFFVGSFIYELFGDIGVIIVPLILWIASLVIIYFTIKDYPMMPYLFGLLVFLNPAVISFVAFFSRDNLLFLFASLMAYFYMKSWEKGSGYYIPMLLLAIFSIYTKSSGSGLFFLLFGLVVWNMRHSLHFLFTNGILGVSAFVIPFRHNWYYGGWLVDFNNVMNSLGNFNGVPLWTFFINPLVYVGLLAGIITRHPLIFWIVGVSILSGIAIYNVSPVFYSYSNILRYTYIYIPFLLICVGKGFQKIGLLR